MFCSWRLTASFCPESDATALSAAEGLVGVALASLSRARRKGFLWSAWPAADGRVLSAGARGWLPGRGAPRWWSTCTDLTDHGLWLLLHVQHNLPAILDECMVQMNICFCIISMLLYAPFLQHLLYSCTIPPLPPPPPGQHWLFGQEGLKLFFDCRYCFTGACY